MLLELSIIIFDGVGSLKKILGLGFSSFGDVNDDFLYCGGVLLGSSIISASDGIDRSACFGRFSCFS